MTDFKRIASAMDINRLQNFNVAIVGVGASADLVQWLGRCGVGSFTLIDLDHVSSSNVARQGFDEADISAKKAKVVAKKLHAINPSVRALYLTEDFCNLDPETVEELFADCDLLIMTTDRHQAQKKGNEYALQYRVPLVLVGAYANAPAAEIIWWHPQVEPFLPCYRCLVPGRYKAQAEAAAQGRSLDPSSHGATILDLLLVDAIAGQIAIGLLTRGSNNRYGRLIDQLGNRNFLQIQIDPEWKLGGRNPVRDYLGVPEDNDVFFSWCTVARTDPDGGKLPCPDCERFLGHQFGVIDGQPYRALPGDPLYRADAEEPQVTAGI